MYMYDFYMRVVSCEGADVLVTLKEGSGGVVRTCRGCGDVASFIYKYIYACIYIRTFILVLYHVISCILGL